MKLEEIGFYTLTDERAATVSVTSPLKRCELIVTSRCNFKCPYCRGVKPEDKGDLTFSEASRIIDMWASHDLENIRFSGGEPTLWPWLVHMVQQAKALGIKRIAVSTNGSASLTLYHDLIRAGVNDFSISLDSCCSSVGDKMAGGIPVFDTVVSNIKALSSLVYTTVGVVLTEDNKHELPEIVSFAASLGVADIRIIPAAQLSNKHDNAYLEVAENFPILKYRVRNFVDGIRVRGLQDSDNCQCPLVLDDMAILNGKHYPCIIYMREQGEAIGTTDKPMENIRNERYEWFKTHNCFGDTICKNNCLDVCVDYNNKVKHLNTKLYK